MSKLPSLIGSKEFITGSVASLVLVSGLSLGGRLLGAAFTPPSTPQEQAADLFKAKQTVKERTKAAHEEFVQADADQQKALTCMQGGDCSFLQGTTPAR